MKKESYKRTELTLTEFQAEDLIATSAVTPDEYEDDIIKANR